MTSLIAELHPENQPEGGLGYLHAPGTDISRCRDQLTAVALMNPKCSHILWIDADESWKPGLARRLLSHGKDIVGAAYRKKGDSIKWTHEPKKDGQREGDLLQCEAAGTGALLVARNVYEKVGTLPELQIDGSTVDMSDPEQKSDFMRHFKGYHLQMIYKGSVHSDDWAFCRRATQCGFEVWIDLGWPIYHYGEKVYYSDARESFPV
jgi:hypothetical protein